MWPYFLNGIKFMFGSFNTSSFNKLPLNSSSLIIMTAANVILYTSIAIAAIGVSTTISNYIPITSSIQAIFNPEVIVVADINNIITISSSCYLSQGESCYILANIPILSSSVVRVEENRIQRSILLGMV